jgi:hypothetical protein
LTASLEIEATLGWMFASALYPLWGVIEAVEGESVDYCVVVFIVLEEVASPMGSSICH